jgi:hypothetical protein
MTWRGGLLLLILSREIGQSTGGPGVILDSG